MKLYIIRHGETDSNAMRVVSGRSDEGLNERGIAQAQELNLKLADTEFVAVYVSPMKRTVETAEIIVPECEFIIDRRIAERDLGDLKGYTIDELWQMPLWNSLDELRTSEGAETLLSGRMRVKEFLDEIKGKYKKNDKVLLVTHSFISRCIWSVINDITDLDEHAKFWHRNEEIKIFEW